MLPRRYHLQARDCDKEVLCKLSKEGGGPENGVPNHPDTSHDGIANYGHRPTEQNHPA